MNSSFAYLPPKERKKILLICDDIRAYSGVATVAKEIVMGTAQHFNWINIAGAVSHPDKGKKLDLSHDINTHSGLKDSSVILYPVDGYSDSMFVRQMIHLEKPDAIFLITDPRYFNWFFGIENEIRKQIPIIYLNIWDSPYPYPLWNKVFYESCDALLAISKQTKNINEVVLGEKAKSKLIKYVPHGLNNKIFFPIDSNYEKYAEFKKFKANLFKNKEYDFVLFFNSRNIRRKQIPDTLLAFRIFLDTLPKETAEKCCILLHTELVSEHGTDLPAVTDYLFAQYPNSIIYHTQGLPPEQMNWLYNCSDGQILITDNEGWGLSLTEALLAGKPIIANVQGGMQDQMRFEDEKGEWINFNLNLPSNHRGTYKKHGSWAFPVYPASISIQGSPQTPYISADRVKPEEAAEQISALYNIPKDIRKQIGLEGRKWAISDEAGFTTSHQAKRVIEALDELFKTWEPREIYELINATEYTPDVTRNHKLIY
jgi:glycosyltransferase involved in cell wall biosynthesis